jgi:hypothetical protein
MIKIELVEGFIHISADKLALYSDGFYMSFKPRRKVFDKFVTFNEHYNNLDTKTKKIYDDLATLRGAKLRTAQNSVKSWYDSLVSDLTTADEIIEFVNLAENCGNETIYTLACFTLADDLDRLGTVDNIRTKYGIQNDITEDEQIQLNKEDEIWNLIKDQ